MQPLPRKKPRRKPGPKKKRRKLGKRKKKPALEVIDVDKISIPRKTKGRPTYYPKGMMRTTVRMHAYDYDWFREHFGSVTFATHVALLLLKQLWEKEKENWE